MLGFGSACLMNGKAQGSQAEKWFDNDFVVEDGGSLKLDNRSREKGYLTLVAWKPESGMTGGKVTNTTGPVTLSKDKVNSVTIYRLEPIARWEGSPFRPCDPPGLQDCPIPIPIPPPPPDAILQRPSQP